jgi:hypothetical protein
MLEAIVRRFDEPNEARTFEKGKFDLVHVGGKQVMRDRRPATKVLPCCLSALFFLLSTGNAAVYSATGAVNTLHSDDSSRGVDSDWLSAAEDLGR